MTKKDYIKIANVIVNTYNTLSNEQVEARYLNNFIQIVTGKFIISLQADSSLFDWQVFTSYINKKIGLNILD